MKAYETEEAPVFDPTKPDGIKPQVDDRIVKAVLISGEWLEIVAGSFKYYVAQPDSEDKSKILPYIQFDLPESPTYGALSGLRVEAFPQSIGAYAYSASAV